MLITRKPTRFTSYPSLNISGHPIQCVFSYKYLGVLITSNLSWTPHIYSICFKTRKPIKFLFHNFYPHPPLMPYSNLIDLSSSFTFLTAPLFGTHLNPLLTLYLKGSSTSVCACVLTIRGLTTLLSTTKLPFLSSSWPQSKLLLFKIFNAYLFFFLNILVNSPHPVRFDSPITITLIILLLHTVEVHLLSTLLPPLLFLSRTLFPLVPNHPPPSLVLSV